MTSVEGSPPVVVFCADNRFAMPLGVAIHSLTSNYGGTSAIQIYVLGNAISEKNRQLVERCVVDGHKAFLHWVEIGEALGGLAAPVGRVSRAAYGRLLLADVLPQHCIKAIYLDADVVVNGDIEELWRIEHCGQVILAAQDYDNLVSAAIFPAHAEAGVPAGRPYFNSGVLSIDLREWRSSMVGVRCLTYLEQNEENRRFNDQEALNAVLWDVWLPLDRTWNCQDPYFETSLPGALRRRLLGASQRQRGASSAKIVHCCGLRKPWEPGYYGEFKDLFYRHLAMTPWGGHKPRMHVHVLASIEDMWRAFRRLVSCVALRRIRHFAHRWFAAWCPTKPARP